MWALFAVPLYDCEEVTRALTLVSSNHKLHSAFHSRTDFSVAYNFEIIGTEILNKTCFSH